MSKEKRRRSFLKTDSMQTRIKMVRKMASVVGTVMRKATCSSMGWKERKREEKVHKHFK